MAKFKFMVLVDPSDLVTAKLADDVVDADIGKPVLLDPDLPDTYLMAADGDAIDGFIYSIEPWTADGKVIGTVQVGGRKRCESSGASTLGALVEAGAVAAVGTAETNGLPLVSTHTAVVDTLENVSADLLLPKWKIISSSAADGTVAADDTSVIIEKV